MILPIEKEKYHGEWNDFLEFCEAHPDSRSRVDFEKNVVYIKKKGVVVAVVYLDGDDIVSKYIPNSIPNYGEKHALELARIVYQKDIMRFRSPKIENTTETT